MQPDWQLTKEVLHALGDLCEGLLLWAAQVATDLRGRCESSCQQQRSVSYV